MRYLDRVTFVKLTGGGYDPETGKNKPQETVFTEIDANVTDLGTDRAQALFGDYTKQRKVIRLLHLYKDPWNYVYVDGVKYQFASNTALRQKQSLIVEEVK